MGDQRNGGGHSPCRQPHEGSPDSHRHNRRPVCNGQITPYAGFHRSLDGGEPFSRVPTRIAWRADYRASGQKYQTAGLSRLIKVHGSVKVWSRTNPERQDGFAEHVNIREWNRTLVAAGRNDEPVRVQGYLA